MKQRHASHGVSKIILHLLQYGCMLLTSLQALLPACFWCSCCREGPPFRLVDDSSYSHRGDGVPIFRTEPSLAESQPLQSQLLCQLVGLDVEMSEVTPSQAPCCWGTPSFSVSPGLLVRTGLLMQEGWLCSGSARRCNCSFDVGRCLPSATSPKVMGPAEAEPTVPMPGC